MPVTLLLDTRMLVNPLQLANAPSVIILIKSLTSYFPQKDVGTLIN